MGIKEFMRLKNININFSNLSKCLYTLKTVSCKIIEITENSCDSEEITISNGNKR